LYAKDDKNVQIGNPYIEGATLEAEIIENKRGEKVKVFKMKPKKRYSKTIGHRKNISLIEIKKINIKGKSTKTSKAEEKEEQKGKPKDKEAKKD
jgi:large subunit ribosomal protein L21